MKLVLVAALLMGLGSYLAAPIRAQSQDQDVEGPLEVNNQAELDAERDFDPPMTWAGLLGPIARSKPNSKSTRPPLGKSKSSEVVVLQAPTFDLKRWFNLQEWVKLIFYPFELVRKICQHFSMPVNKTMQKLDQQLVRGLEPLLYPLVYSVRVVEKLFKPDQCRLKFVCGMGHHLDFVREHVLKFSPNFLEGSSQLKALSEGVVGRDCSAMFPECELQLKKPFEELTTKESPSDSSQARQMSPPRGSISSLKPSASIATMSAA